MKIFAALFALAFSCAAFGAVDIAQKDFEKMSKRFESELVRIGATSGAACVVADGKTVFGRDYIFKRLSSDTKKFALGRTSQALLSLMFLSVESDGIAGLKWNVAKHCSYFKLGKNSAATFDDLLSMRAGVDAHSDTLVPPDASSAEVFEIAGQLPPTAPSGETFARSDLSAALAGYTLAYLCDKREKNFKKSFAACSKKYLFAPLKFDEPRFSAFDKPLFPAYAYALSIADVSKWLEAETSPNLPFASRESVAARRLARGAHDMFGCGWLASNSGEIPMFVAADYFENCANTVAIFPSENFAVAFFATSADMKNASKICADALSVFADMISKNLKNKHNK